MSSQASSTCPRSSLVCLPCRLAHSKCDGNVPAMIGSPSSQTLSTIPADLPCSRCQRLNLECHWRPANRTGRPKRRRSRAESSQTTDNGMEWSAGQATMPPLSSSPFDDHFEMPSQQPPILDREFYDLVSQSLEDETWLSLFSIAPEDNLDVAMTGTDDSSKFPSIMEPVERTAKTPSALSLTAPRMARSLAPQSSPYISSQISSDMMLGLHRYFKSIGRTSSSLGLEADFMRRVDSCQEILLSAVSSVGHLFYEGSESERYMTARRKAFHLLSSSAEPDGKDAQVIIDYITALTLITYIEYGADDAEQASYSITRACQIALHYGLNSIDSHVQTSPLADMCRKDATLLEAGRRTWWELVYVDAILHVATSGQVNRQLSSLPVNSVSPPCIPGTLDREPCRVRSQALMLMEEVLGPEASPLGSLDKILANLISTVQTTWLSYAKRASDEQDADPTAGQAGSKSSPLNVGQSVLFQTLLMLHAIRLQLHRQAWFPGVTFDYTSCSFPSGSISTQDGAFDEPEGRVEKSGSMSSSIIQIMSCSSSILGLMQIDSEQHFRRANRVKMADLPLISPHWPFIGCCQMAASYGYAMASSQLPMIGSNGDMMKASSSSASEKRLQLWKRREDISNVGFAEATLGNLAQVWKVCKSYRAMVHQCRITLEEQTQEDL